MTVLFVFMLFGVELLYSNIASAHQSGCHRWHSCPSDSGSYTCGDWGYSNYCPTTSSNETTYTAPVAVRDYAAEGNSDGSAKAEDEKQAIETTIRKVASEEAVQDVNEGSRNNPGSTSLSFVSACIAPITFETDQTYKYYYNKSYGEKCDKIAKETYSTAYDVAFAEEERAKASRDASTFWGWAAFIGITTWLYFTFKEK